MLRRREGLGQVARYRVGQGPFNASGRLIRPCRVRRQFAPAQKEVEGSIDVSSETELVFTARKKPFAGQEFRIEYARIIDLEYGQKAGRRVGVAISTAVLLSPVGLFALFSKKRGHYLTIGYTDPNEKEQVAIIELGKDIVRTSLAIIQTRSRKEIEYQDDEARKAGRG